MMVYKVLDPRFADAEDEDLYQAARKKNAPDSRTEIESSLDVTFSPPLYIQRYSKVSELCKVHNFKRIADFGCAELTLVQYLKNLDFVEAIFAVDIDRKLLESSQHRCRPLMAEYLNPRDRPLNIHILCGSVLEFDSRLAGLDCIVCVELIEHLDLEDVDKFLENVFGTLQPHHVLISTPNSDFNVLFNFEPGQMRHWDHRFEWSSTEFAERCEVVRNLYHYDYEIFGVGNPPEESKNVGFCSQFALFSRSSDRFELRPQHDMEIYETVYQTDFPVRDQSITEDDRLLNEIIFLVRSLGQEELNTMGHDLSVIPIKPLLEMPGIAQYLTTVEHIAELATTCEDFASIDSSNYTITVRNIPPSSEYDSGEDDEEEDWASFEEENRNDNSDAPFQEPYWGD